MQLHLIELQEMKTELADGSRKEPTEFWSSHTHEIPEQVHVIFLDPVAEDLCGSVALGEHQLDEPRRLLLGRCLGLETAILLVSCRKRLELFHWWLAANKLASE